MTFARKINLLNFSNSYIHTSTLIQTHTIKDTIFISQVEHWVWPAKETHWQKKKKKKETNKRTHCQYKAIGLSDAKSILLHVRGERTSKAKIFTGNFTKCKKSPWNRFLGNWWTKGWLWRCFIITHSNMTVGSHFVYKPI